MVLVLSLYVLFPRTIFFFARFLVSIDAYMLETTSAAYECMFLFPLRCIYKSCVVCSLGVNARKDSGMINIVV